MEGKDIFEVIKGILEGQPIWGILLLIVAFLIGGYLKSFNPDDKNKPPLFYILAAVIIIIILLAVIMVIYTWNDSKT